MLLLTEKKGTDACMQVQTGVTQFGLDLPLKVLQIVFFLPLCRIQFKLTHNNRLVLNCNFCITHINTRSFQLRI